MPDGDVGRWEKPRPVSHSSVSGALGFGPAVFVTLRLRIVRVEAAVHRRSAARDASHSGPHVWLNLRLGLRVLWQREAAALPRRYRLKNRRQESQWRLTLVQPWISSYHVPALQRWSPGSSTSCPRWTAVGASPWSTACGDWRWCPGWRDSWVTARSCSHAAWGSGPGLVRRAEGWGGWSHTAAELSDHPRIYTTWGGADTCQLIPGGAWVCEHAHEWHSPATPPLSGSQGHPGPAGTLLVLIWLMELCEGGVWQILHLKDQPEHIRTTVITRLGQVCGSALGGLE